MSEPIITMIYPANIPQLWSDAEPILAPAIAIADTHTALDIYRMIMGGKAQLWLQWSGKIDAVVITEFVPYPKGLWLRFWLAGAQKGASILWQQFFQELYKFARDSKCVGIEDCGREGWDRHIPEGYKAERAAVLRRIRIGE